ncbi:hypothetical protein [Microbulbifer sp. TYP-18]|uniref:hypothetical protein n=1 Tax=Microbulbifer sp. TYP-18 TaxID=3230024 RepID=UPI0034C5C2AF
MKNIGFLFLLGFSSLVSAYTSVTGPVDIKNLRVYPSNYVLFKAPDASNTVENCDVDGGWIYLQQETEAQKRQFSVLLSARMANQPVYLYFNGCSNGGTSGYRVVEQVML